MLRRCTWAFFKVSAPPDAHGVPVTRADPAQRRRRQFARATDASGNNNAVPGRERLTKHAFIPPQKRQHGNQSVGRPLAENEHYRASPFPDSTNFTQDGKMSGSATSQRQRFRAQRGDSPEDASAPASYLSPLPKKYGFYDGIDTHALEGPRPSAALRQRMMRQALEEQAASVVEFTEGGESDIDLGGMPASEYHGQEGWTTIPRDSALYNNVVAKQDLESRQRLNSWGVARRQRHHPRAQRDGGTRAESERAVGARTSPIGDLMGEYAAQAEGNESEALDAVRRRRHHDEGAYTNLLESELLEPTPASIGQPRSVYGLRKMFINGLVGYQGIISSAEEAEIAEELMHLLQDQRAAYVAEEARYCVNLYETELGVPGKDTLAFPIARAPALQRALYRFFFLGLIPAPPNVIQVSEMVGNFSGYPVHRKPRAIGPYVGLLNLVSTTVMHMQHVDCPWFPRVHMNPRSLFVVSEPCLSEYAMGYKQTHQPFHTFEYATRVSKDYRIEVMFATVETAHMKFLNEAVQLTDYANEKMQKMASEGTPLLTGVGGAATGNAGGCSPSSAVHTSLDNYLERLRSQVHAATEVAPQGDGGAARAGAAVIVDGNLLRKQLLEYGVVGRKAHTFESRREGEGVRPSDDSSRLPPSSAAATTKRKTDALKARYDFARRLKSEGMVSKESQGGGPRLIRGHAPGDNRDW